MVLSFRGTISPWSTQKSSPEGVEGSLLFWDNVVAVGRFLVLKVFNFFAQIFIIS